MHVQKEQEGADRLLPQSRHAPAATPTGEPTMSFGLMTILLITTQTDLLDSAWLRSYCLISFKYSETCCSKLHLQDRAIVNTNALGRENECHSDDSARRRDLDGEHPKPSVHKRATAEGLHIPEQQDAEDEEGKGWQPHTHLQPAQAMQGSYCLLPSAWVYAG